MQKEAIEIIMAKVENQRRYNKDNIMDLCCSVTLVMVRFFFSIFD
jgi:hypothetical protein